MLCCCYLKCPFWCTITESLLWKRTLFTSKEGSYRIRQYIYMYLNVCLWKAFLKMLRFDSCFLFSLTRSQKMIESNSTWEGAFYQGEWAKINSSWVILVFFHFMYVATNTSELFCMAFLSNIECFLYHSNLSF